MRSLEEIQADIQVLIDTAVNRINSVCNFENETIKVRPDFYYHQVKITFNDDVNKWCGEILRIDLQFGKYSINHGAGGWREGVTAETMCSIMSDAFINAKNIVTKIEPQFFIELTEQHHEYSREIHDICDANSKKKAEEDEVKATEMLKEVIKSGEFQRIAWFEHAPQNSKFAVISKYKDGIRISPITIHKEQYDRTIYYLNNSRIAKQKLIEYMNDKIVVAFDGMQYDYWEMRSYFRNYDKHIRNMEEYDNFINAVTVKK